MTKLMAYRIYVNGIVQGVGFRPFIYGLAIRYQLKGWVRNTSGGVEIEVAGTRNELDRFLTSIVEETPPLAQIDSIKHEIITPDGYESFQIHHSKEVAGGYQPISPDVSICDDCLEELFTPTDQRYRYPFINCTNCGPRFSIIQDIPYDRPLTTMADFSLCSTCKSEYEDPLDRRFHAQPVACPECGPRVWLESAQNPGENLAVENIAIEKTQKLLSNGDIVAIKGLGGFHLACNAEDETVLMKLRDRKNRPFKPLAVMMPDLATIRDHCQISDKEIEILTSPQRPILLLNKKSSSNLPEAVAPGQNTIGVMLPYTPLHYLLFSKNSDYPDVPYSVLVMTSANIRSNPILTDNQHVKDNLAGIADYFLLHDRDIQVHCDDSVARVHQNLNFAEAAIYPIRRSRGYAPQPLQLPLSSSSVLGVGAELKNTFCLTKDSYGFLSQHIGDLKNLETLNSFEKSIVHFEDLFRSDPELLVCDLHPDYLSTRYAIDRSENSNVPVIKTQHHHAHVTSCLADNNYHGKEPVIGITFDGTGYGEDGAIWGGEFLIADYKKFNRLGYLQYFPLPGGDKATREPWRIALSLLDSYGLSWDPTNPAVKFGESIQDKIPGLSTILALKKQLESKINTPMTSSIGRLFDGVSALIGVCQIITYEGQAAIELESLVDPDERESYCFEISNDYIINPGTMLESILRDIQEGIAPSRISAKFHNGLADIVLEMAIILRKEFNLNLVALSGGVWQNMTLLHRSVNNLIDADFEVLLHQKVPPNDGGISLGQAVIGQNKL